MIGGHAAEEEEVVEFITFLSLFADKTWIKDIDVHLSREYATDTVESCRTVSVPTTGEFAINFMCGNVNALKCTADQFFNFIGNNPFSPFIINFKLHSANDSNNAEFTPPDMKTFSCWEAPDVSVKGAFDRDEGADRFITFVDFSSCRIRRCLVRVWTVMEHVPSLRWILQSQLRW